MAAVRAPRWPSTVRAAQRVQIALRKRLSVGDGPRAVRLVAGADCAFSPDGQTIWAGIAVVALPGLEPVATAWAAGRGRVPYVPGYLSFRGGPGFLRAARRLSLRPDPW